LQSKTVCVKLLAQQIWQGKQARKKLKVEEKKMQDYLTKLLDELDQDQILLNQEEGYDD